MYVYVYIYTHTISFALQSVPVSLARAGFPSDLMPENSTLNAMIAGFHPACHLPNLEPANSRMFLCPGIQRTSWGSSFKSVE